MTGTSEERPETYQGTDEEYIFQLRDRNSHSLYVLHIFFNIHGHIHTWNCLYTFVINKIFLPKAVIGNTKDNTKDKNTFKFYLKQV